MLDLLFQVRPLSPLSFSLFLCRLLVNTLSLVGLVPSTHLTKSLVINVHRALTHALILCHKYVRFQRRHVPTLGTLKSFILAEVVAGEGEGAGGGRGGRGGWDGGAERGEGQRHLDREWSACRRIVDQTRASAARGDSRPQLLTEYVCLLLAEQGIDCPAWAQLD